MSRRAAFAHPRALATTLVMAVLLSAWWVAAQGTKKAPAPVSNLAPVAAGQISSSDVEGIVRAAAARKQAAGGYTAKRFALTENDITPNTQSDEIEPSYDPTGRFIVFTSNGIDSNGDKRLDTTGFSVGGKYHVWIMNRDGTGQAQLTGLTTNGPLADVNFTQSHPSFSPDGNRIVFKAQGLRRTVDADGNVSNDTTQAGNLFVLTIQDLNTPANNPIEQITSFLQGEVNGPNWGGSTSSIVFAHSGNVDGDVLDTAGNFDIFKIPSTGPNANPNSLQRLTGGAKEANPADRPATNLNPAFSVITPSSQIYFSSTRINNAGNNARRIWLMTGEGNLKRQITDPTARVAGQATDNDDYPAPSLSVGGTFAERVGFQSNSLIDGTDNTPDLNVWSVNFITRATPTPVPTNTPVPPPPPALNVNNYGGVQSGGGGEVKSFTLNGNPNGNFINTNVAGSPANGNQLEGIVYGPDANGDGFAEVFISVRNANKVNRYDGRTGVPFGVGANPYR